MSLSGQFLKFQLSCLVEARKAVIIVELFLLQTLGKSILYSNLIWLILRLITGVVFILFIYIYFAALYRDSRHSH